MQMEDLTRVVHYFKGYIDENLSKRFNGRGLAKVNGVKIACKRQQRVLGTKKFSAIQLPPHHPVCLGKQMTHISRLIDIPLRALKVTPDSELTTNGEDSSACDNKELPHFTSIVTREATKGAGHLEYWRENVGNVIVVRADGKDLLPRQLEIICDFCQYEIGPLFEEAMSKDDENGLPNGHAEITAAMTPAEFAEYFNR